MPKGIYQHKKGYKHSEDWKKKASKRLVGNTNGFKKGNTHRKGITLPNDIKNKISKNRKGKSVGEERYNWIKDRTKLSKKQMRNDYAYVWWIKQCKKRDNYECRINNKDCSGKLEVHHILSWRDYPELRYDKNNGITVCHYHHPRKREEEATSIPMFQKLINTI